MTIALILGVLLLFVASSAACFKWGGDTASDVGKSLLTGAVLSFTLLLLQLHLDAERKLGAEKEQFALSVSFAHDLSGLEPKFSMAGMSLARKVLNEAELQGEDLSQTNLEHASLRGANLSGAELANADLYGADLTGANLLGADLTQADLRGTQFKRATMDFPLDAKLKGAQVDARTCWPEDYLANFRFPPNEDLRAELDRQPTFDNGRTLVESTDYRSFGHACVLSDENIVDDLGLYLPPRAPKTGVIPFTATQTLDQVGATFGRDPSQISARLEHSRPMTAFGPQRPSLSRRLCANARKIHGRAGYVTTEGFTFLAIGVPGGQPSQTSLVKIPEDQPGKEFVLQVKRPLPDRTSVTLFAEKPIGGEIVRYRLDRRVATC